MIGHIIFTHNEEIVKKVAVFINCPFQLTVGNGKSAEPVDIVYDSTFVSRKHALIEVDENGRVFISDSGSSNGTFLNGDRLESEKKYSLNEKDEVIFANQPGARMRCIGQDLASTVFGASAVPGSVDMVKLLDQKGLIKIGRKGFGNDIEFDDPLVSRNHAGIRKLAEGKYMVMDTSSNGTYVNGNLITGEVEAGSGDVIGIAGHKFSIAKGLAKSEFKGVEALSLKQKLLKKNKIIAGRNPDCDIFIDDQLVSRNHAEISKEDGAYFITDLNSTNGTFINNQQIKGKVRFTENDTIFIGLQALKLDEVIRDLTLETAIRAENVEKTYPGGYVGLKKMSVHIPHRAFVALMGPSGCGKTTFMNALNGNNPATGGKVFIHGLELTANYNVLKRKIGYVPQDDIVHHGLSVEKSLYFAAKLRLPNDTTEQEINERIDEVLSNLNINDPEIRKNKVGSLSGGQRKRVSIAVELLNKPSILFLDEPTSPLDPETIEEFLNNIRKLTEKGTTVVMVTHKPEDLNYVDRVIFLATKGYHAFYGDKKDLLAYFGCKNIIGVYSLLSKKNEVEKWYSKWYAQQTGLATPESAGKINKERSESLLLQLFWLTRRYFRLKLSDTGNIVLLMAQPVIIALLLIFIFEKLQMGVLFLMAISAIWFGVSNAAKEIVGEIPIYKRERMFNLNIFTYLISKMVVLSAIALVQVILFVTIVKLRYISDPVDLVFPVQYTVFMFYLAFSATLLGLLLSAVFSNTEKVMTVVPIALMPQIMLAGVVTRIDNVAKELLSYITLGRWGTEGFARIQDNFADYRVVDKLITHQHIDTNMNVMPPTFTVRFDTIPDTVSKSLYASIPRTTTDTLMIKDSLNIPYTTSIMIDNKVNALGQLGFYDHKLLGLFGSLHMNMLVITALNVIVFIGLYFALKRKDTL